MPPSYSYPTPEHEKAALEVMQFFSRRLEVEAVLLTCSCARGRAAPDSCLDFALLHYPDLDRNARQRLEAAWSTEYASNGAFAALRALGPYTQVDLEFIDGVFHEGYHGWCSGPDAFELEIGNFVQYVVPLFTRGTYFAELRSRWLPFYPEAMRSRRLSMVINYCLNNLDHIQPYARRGLYFQCFKRLYDAQREFLQALFIARRVYPIAYDKWIQEQLVAVLDLPDVYREMVQLMEFKRFESDEHEEKATKLKALVATHLVD
jgi:hypothetical protein